MRRVLGEDVKRLSKYSLILNMIVINSLEFGQKSQKNSIFLKKEVINNKEIRHQNRVPGLMEFLMEPWLEY
jgi:hypothetical protein